MTENISDKILARKIIAYVDEDKNTALHYAAASGNLKSVGENIEKGHEPDPVNYLGWTPLMMATRHGHLDVVQLLLENGVDSTRRNSFGYNILLLAVASANLDVLHFILQHLLQGGVSRRNMQSFLSPISLSILYNNKGMFQYLIEKGFCINVLSNTGISPLMFASGTGNSEIMNMLLNRGVKQQVSRKPEHVVSIPQANNYNLSPMVLANSHFSPQPYLNYQLSVPRRCSDIESPCFTQNLSPFSFVPQIFFPPQFPSQFSPNHFFSPVNAIPVFHNNDVLNMNIGQYCSPVPMNVPYNPV